MKKTHYDLLQVARDASADHIKAQYRRLAKHYHPDLNPNNKQAAEQFRELHAAYTVLADADTRQAYDSTLAPPPPVTPKATESEDWLDDWLRSVIANNLRHSQAAPANEPDRPRRKRSRIQTKPTQPRQAYLKYNLELRVQDLFKGAQRTLTIGETTLCRKCKGRPCTPVCPMCDGFGFTVCPVLIDVDVPPGVLPGMSMRVEIGRDAETQAMPWASSVTITFTLPADAGFTHDGPNLYTTVAVPAETLANGGQRDVSAPDGGAAIHLTIPPNTASGTVLTVRKRGLPNGASHRRGNLYCTLVQEAGTAAA